MATRTDDEIIAFITGKETVPNKEIPTKLWGPILREAVMHMPMNDLRTVKNIKAILTPARTSNFRPERVLPLILSLRFGKDVVGLDATDMEFFVCDEFEDFPETWEKAPRKAVPAEHGLQDEVCVTITCEHLLLSRTKKFSLLHSEWVPHEEWDTRSIQDRPSSFYYQLDTSSSETFFIRDISDDELSDWLENNDDGQPAVVRIMRRMLRGLDETATTFDHQAAAVRDRRGKISLMLSRMGAYAGD